MTPDVLGLGAAAGGLAVLVRALPWPESWKSRKPLGCHACLAGWCALAVVLLRGFAVQIGATGGPQAWAALALSWLAAAGVAALVLAVASPLPATLDLTEYEVLPAAPADRCGQCGRAFDDGYNTNRRLV